MSELYELILNEKEHAKFLNNVFDELNKRSLSLYGLANEIGYKKGSLYEFTYGRTRSKFVAASIHNYLFEEKEK